MSVARSVASWAPCATFSSLGAAVLALFAHPVACQPHPKVAPFEMVRFAAGAPEVLVAGTWWRPLAVGGVAIADLLAHAKRAHGDLWDKRFCEDLPQLLSELGRTPGESVELVLEDVESGTRTTLPKVAMSAEHRRAIRKAAPRANAAPAPPPRRTERVHAETILPSHRALTARVWNGARDGHTLAPAQAAHDLDQLEWALENTFSYLTLRSVDHRGGLDSIRAGVGSGIDVRDFQIQLRKLVAQFGDGHSRVQGIERALPEGCLPLRLADVGGRLAALAPDRDELLDEAYPWLDGIDGLPLARWTDAAAALATHGSRQFQRREALRFLPWIAYLRREMGLPVRATAELTLCAAKGGGFMIRQVRLAPRAPTPARLPQPPDGHRRLDDGLGYVRLARMNQDGTLGRALADLADTPGLVIDVRDNGGGTRHPLLELLAAILPKESGPRVCNAAAFRVPPDAGPMPAEGFLANRFLFPESAPHWNEAERNAIAQFRAAFQPAWPPPAGAFSPWHYLVVSPSATGPRYRGRIVVLMNEGCFSATDVFLGALQGLPNVTLMGTPSGGGSGRAQQIELVHSRIRVMLSTMASFRVDGTLFDGNGVLPAVLQAATLQDLLGRGDSVLDAARAWLRR